MEGIDAKNLQRPRRRFVCTAGKTVAIIGYGNQGEAQAKSIRDSGVELIIGSIVDQSAERAKNDGFPVFSIAEETELDLFAEQAVWPIIMRDIQVAFEVLVEEGFSPEMVALDRHVRRRHLSLSSVPPSSFRGN